MNRLRFPLLGLVVVLALAATACGSVSSYAATVDGTRITPSDLEGELRAIGGNDNYLKFLEAQVQVRSSGVFDAAFTAQVLTNQIFYEMIRQELERRKTPVSPADLDAVRPSVATRAGGEEILNAFAPEYRDTLLRRAAEVSVLSFALLEQGTPDESAKAYFDSHQDEFAQACVRHILVPTKEEADGVKGRLDAGENFGDVAKTTSKDPGSAAQGGELGCFPRDNQLVAEFAQAMFAQQVNQVGPPVQTQFGFHLILVTSRDQPTFEQAQSAARDKAVAAGQEKFTNWLTGTIEKAKVSVNPKYGAFEKKGTESRVVPPQAPTTPPAAPSGTTDEAPPPVTAPGG